MSKLKQVFITLTLFIISLNASAYTLELSKTELERYAQAYFPITQQTPFSKVRYSSPKIVLDEKTNRIGLEVTVHAEMPGMMAIAGRGQIDGKLEYRQQSHQFYLHDPKIKNVRFANTSYELANSIQQMANSMSQQTLPMIFVYELKDNDLRQKMAKNVLKSARVQQGKLYLDMELPF